MKILICVAILAVSFVSSAVIGKFLIPFLHKLKYGQTILDIGPNWHKKKEGTPTMGGIMFILGTVSFVPLILEIILVLRCVKKYNQTPHSHYSHTKEIAYGRKVMEKFDVEEAEKSSLCD